MIDRRRNEFLSVRSFSMNCWCSSRVFNSSSFLVLVSFTDSVRSASNASRCGLVEASVCFSLSRSTSASVRIFNSASRFGCSIDSLICFSSSSAAFRFASVSSNSFFSSSISAMRASSCFSSSAILAPASANCCKQ